MPLFGFRVPAVSHGANHIGIGRRFRLAARSGRRPAKSYRRDGNRAARPDKSWKLRVSSPGTGRVVSVNVAPSTSLMTPHSTGPVRIFGPCKSCKIATGWPISALTPRRLCDVFGLQIRAAVRKIEARHIHAVQQHARIIAFDREAGPMVGTIFARRVENWTFMLILVMSKVVS